MGRTFRDNGISDDDVLSFHDCLNLPGERIEKEGYEGTTQDSSLADYTQSYALES